jgi:UDP-3-O-[3-hydroxymyristoyl] glucosamine N-acyltransferase
MQFTAEMIAGFLNGTIVGDKNASVSTVSSIDGGKAGSLAYLTNPRYEQYIYTTEASIVLVDKTFEPKEEVKATLIKVENVAECVLNLLEMYNAAKPRKTGIAKMASISEEATVGENCYVGDFAVIERGAKIGDNVQIYPQCYIGDNVTIGEGTKLYPGVKIYEGCRIGKNCILHAGSVIGADGFGFAPREDGTFAKIPQLGIVILEDNVEIGANTCIDRAKTDATIIHSGVKLDNLIQLGHNVEVGANTVMSAQVGIAGTTKVGSNCFIAGQVGIADHITVGNGVKIGSKSGIDKSVADGEIRFGYPALPGVQYHRSFAVFRQLPDMAYTLRKLEKAVAALEAAEKSE